MLLMIFYIKLVDNTELKSRDLEPQTLQMNALNLNFKHATFEYSYHTDFQIEKLYVYN